MRLVLSCLLVLFAGTTVAAQEHAEWLTGTWEGTGYQTDDNSTWTMKLTVSGGRYLIEYPSLNCSGRWHPLSLGPSHAIFRERIIVGLVECVDRGRVILQRLNRNQIAYRFSNPGSREFTASAILNRRKSNPRNYPKPRPKNGS